MRDAKYRNRQENVCPLKVYNLDRTGPFDTPEEFMVDPIDKIAFSKVAILHQNRYLIEPVLQKISKIFKKALEWSPPSPLNHLKSYVGLIRYLFSHAMPFDRGSAGIGEWLEIMIYRFHGFSCKHNNEAKGDLEALVAPFLSTFLKDEYDKTINLT